MSAESRSGAQPASAKQWLGQLVDGVFPLHEYLGAEDTGALYATEFEGQRASIKVVPAVGKTADQLIWRWRLASKVNHPHLVRLWKIGRAQLNGTAVAYVVMENAEENLGQVLPDRALTSAEAKEMLAPALDAIACIHREGFVHGRLMPSNFMAVNDVLKLSSDSIRRVAEVDDFPTPQGAYRPPEAAAGARLSPASDIWALGVTLIETLTQREPSRTGANNELQIPEGIGEPFLDIIRRCLRPNPQQRCTAADAIELLHGTAKAPSKSRVLWYAVPAAAAVIALAIWIGRSSPNQPSAPPAATSATIAAPVPAPSQPVQPVQAKPAPPPPETAVKPPDPEPDPPTVSTSPDVVTQVMPEVLDKARRSIHGTVTVAVKAHTDAYGVVKEATAASSRGGRYFTGVAVKAVRRWKFRPIKTGDTFTPQDWTVHFEFTRTDTKIQVDPSTP